MGKTTYAVVAAAALTMLAMGCAAAATLDECIVQPADFDRPRQTGPVTAAGSPGQKIRIHPAHPQLCRNPDDGACRAVGYIVPGDRVTAAKRCGPWVYAQYVGKSSTTFGWLDAHDLAGDLPPDLVNPEQIAPDPTKLSYCNHWLWYGHRGVIVGSPGEHIDIYRRNPLLCSKQDVGLCQPIANVLPGTTQYVGEPCGRWVYVSWMGMASGRPIPSGWIDSSKVTRLPDDLTLAHMRNYSKPTYQKYDDDALYEAVTAGNVNKVKALLAAGRDINELIPTGVPMVRPFTVLMQAVDIGNPDMVKALLDLGADPSVHDPHQDCSDALAMAVLRPDITDLLIRAGSDVNCGRGERRPLGLAASQIAPESAIVLKQLIAAGANLNIDHGSPLRAAVGPVGPNNVEAAEILLAAGANPNLTGHRGHSTLPLLMAAMRAYSVHWDPAMIALLLGHGADPNYRDPLPYDPDRDVPGNPNGINFAGQTALTAAVDWGFFEIARLLLDRGADPSLPREDGERPAQIANARHHPELEAMIESYVTKPPAP